MLHEKNKTGGRGVKFKSDRDIKIKQMSGSSEEFGEELLSLGVVIGVSRAAVEPRQPIATVS